MCKGVQILFRYGHRGLGPGSVTSSVDWIGQIILLTLWCPGQTPINKLRIILNNTGLIIIHVKNDKIHNRELCEKHEKNNK